MTPIFFSLFPGYSPSKEVELHARKCGKTSEAGNLTLISMGQGQEAPAEAVLDKCALHSTMSVLLPAAVHFVISAHQTTHAHRQTVCLDSLRLDPLA
jgi:Dynein heavy chain region D6 P-loop domain